MAYTDDMLMADGVGAPARVRAGGWLLGGLCAALLLALACAFTVPELDAAGEVELPAVELLR